MPATTRTSWLPCGSINVADSDKKPWPVMSLQAAHDHMTVAGTLFEMEEREVRGVSMRVWKNAPPTLRDIFLAGRAHGDKTFLVYEDERASFEAFARAALAIAHALAAEGVVKGDRVVIAMRNLPEWPAAFYGTLLLGAIATPLNAWWTGAELEYALLDSGAKVAVVDAERLHRMAECLPRCTDLQRVFVSRGADTLMPDDSASLSMLRRLEDVTGTVNDWMKLPDRPLPSVMLHPEDDATIFYTSGTTGQPKGALGTHRNSVCTIVATSFSAQRNFVRRGEPVPKPEDRLTQRASLVSIPFFHTTGCQAVLNPALLAGSKIVTMHRWDVERAMALIERERCTQAGGVPTIAWQIIEHPARAQYDLSSLENMAYGGAPAAAELVRRIAQAFPASQPGTGWGMTETSATFTNHGSEDYVQRPESCGPALPVCDMKIVDDQGLELPRGTVGELWGKGPNVVKGYWRKPEATAETFADGWVKTGDLARMDDEGYLYIVDRKKDMLIRGGENIYCVEVEDALYTHAAVMDAGVVGIPHRLLGEEPVAVVQLKPGETATEAQLQAFVSIKLAAFKVPVRILILPDALPRNPNGKLLKKELKQLFI